MKDDKGFPRAALRRYDIIISVIFLLMGGAAILVRTGISMCETPASEASVAVGIIETYRSPDSGRRRVLPVMKRAHLLTNERLRSDPTDPDSHD